MKNSALGKHIINIRLRQLLVAKQIYECHGNDTSGRAKAKNVSSFTYFLKILIKNSKYVPISIVAVRSNCRTIIIEYSFSFGHSEGMIF